MNETQEGNIYKQGYGRGEEFRQSGVKLSHAKQVERASALASRDRIPFLEQGEFIKGWIEGYTGKGE